MCERHYSQLVAHRRSGQRAVKSKKSGCMSRLSEFTIDELYAVVFALDVAQTVEPLDELAASIREEMLEELRLRNIDQPT
jgi:hypothetical protein